MKKFKIACIALSVLALPFMMSCSKSSSSSEEEQIESFNTINARLYYTNSSLVPESVEMGIGETIQIYAGNGSTKAPFNGTVKWTAVGSGELALSAVQRNAAAAGVAPGTKAGYD